MAKGKEKKKKDGARGKKGKKGKPSFKHGLPSKIDPIPDWNRAPLVPVKPFLPRLPPCAPCDAAFTNLPPRVQIIASKRVVATGSLFSIKVLAQSTIGLKKIWWFGIDTGIADLDRATSHELSGELSHEQIWEGVVINEPGVYRLGADSSDILHGAEPGVPHQASEGLGISECTFEVRDDISYGSQVDLVRARYGMTGDWQRWMESGEIGARYVPVWNMSKDLPTMLKIAFGYGGGPIAYDPPWSNELQHMNALANSASLVFPGLNFDFLFGASPDSADMQVAVGGLGEVSRAGGRGAYLYYETIFGHEFGHLLRVQHHYLGNDIGNSVFLPPGETKCTMARSASEYCSGCRAAMHLNLDAANEAAIHRVNDDILDRYPY